MSTNMESSPAIDLTVPRSTTLRGLVTFFKSALHPVTSIFLITFLVAIVAAAFTSASLADVAATWGSGFTSNFAFAMQFMLLMLLSYTLATTPLYLKGARALSGLFATTKSAVIFLVLFSSVLSWFNWALGVVGGVVLARQIARAARTRGRKSNFPLLVAAGLAGLVVSESGMSGNVLLFMTQETKLFSGFGTFPLGVSALSAFNIVVNLVVAVAIAAVLSIFADQEEDMDLAMETLGEEPKAAPATNVRETLAVKMENSRWVSIVFGCIGLLYIVLYFSRNSAMNFNTYLLLLIMLGIVLRKAPLSYQADVISASSCCWVFFFPLIFAGAIQAMLNMEATSGFISGILTSLASEGSFPAVNMIAATAVNLLVPNAGAQWLIEGQGVMAAGRQLSAAPMASILSFCYGAGIAKLLNLFVMLPIVAVVSKEFTPVYKYTIISAGIAALIYLVALSLFL